MNSESKYSAKRHWEKTYARNDESKLGWYQTKASPSLELIKQAQLKKEDFIIDVGSGSSVLIDNLLELGYENIIASDVSQAALEKSRERLGSHAASKLRWIVDDLTRPAELNQLNDIALWHDRAVLHFLTDKRDRDAYLDLMNTMVKQGGYVIIAAFNLQGAEKCSGLPVQRYDKTSLTEFLGDGFDLIHSFDFDYTMPSGANRPYVYTLFRKL